MNTNHHRRCIDNALGAIGENNMATEARGDVYDMANMPAEDEATALEWLANGNVDCHDEGERCS